MSLTKGIALLLIGVFCGPLLFVLFGSLAAAIGDRKSPLTLKQKLGAGWFAFLAGGSIIGALGLVIWVLYSWVVGG